jgi:lipopolysaccharide assembly outer membrane protein LptD (OstA)
VLAAGGTVEWQASDRLKLGLSYYHRTPSGTTPFLFDDVQIGHEFGPSIDWRVNPRWRVAVSGRHDLSNSRWRAFDVMVARTLDCMEYGLTYSRTRREIGLHVALLNFGGGAGVVTPPICRDIMPSPNE